MAAWKRFHVLSAFILGSRCHWVIVLFIMLFVSFSCATTAVNVDIFQTRGIIVKYACVIRCYGCIRNYLTHVRLDTLGGKHYGNKMVASTEVIGMKKHYPV